MNTPLTATHVFFSRSRNSVIDTATNEPTPRGHYQGETLEQIRAKYPDAELIAWETASRIMDEANRLPVSEITEQEFWYYLEVLPPAGWRHGTNNESFKMSERYSGYITSIFARQDNRYFQLRDDIRLSHDEIMRRVSEYIRTH